MSAHPNSCYAPASSEAARANGARAKTSNLPGYPAQAAARPWPDMICIADVTRSIGRPSTATPSLAATRGAKATPASPLAHLKATP